MYNKVLVSELMLNSCFSSFGRSVSLKTLTNSCKSRLTLISKHLFCTWTVIYTTPWQYYFYCCTGHYNLIFFCILRFSLRKKDNASKQSEAYGVLVQQLKIPTFLCILLTPTLWNVTMNQFCRWGTMNICRSLALFSAFSRYMDP